MQAPYRKPATCTQDEDYGQHAAEPDLSVEEIHNRKVEFLKKLQNRASTEDKRRSIEKDTRGQHNNQLWGELRLDYLTASNFGKVIKRKNISPHNLLKELLYKNSNLMTVGILYGRTHKKEAIQKYEAANKMSVNECGFFTGETYNFLGASPDGLIADQGVVEVKCLSSVKDTLKDAVCSNSCYKVGERPGHSGHREVPPSMSTSLDTPSTSCSETPANSHYMNERETTPPSQFIPPHVIQPYPKAQKNDSGLKGRKKRKSQILTDTPIRDEIAENENLKITKKAKITVKKNISITDKKTDPSSSSDSETISELSKTNTDKKTDPSSSSDSETISELSKSNSDDCIVF
ncbi:Viral alkaline exonuclease [Popillia japonica]|uniref:Viral alkaline exonuclease n=1 Tax=Popillia japonica TaxID=7064 RepID=A0AAW1M997_POPJA